MAELLVRILDKVNTDKILDSKCTKRGDVISVCPDGWEWGTEEINSAQWAIIKLPNVTTSEASVFLSPEIDIDPQNPSLFLQRRSMKLNLDAMPDITRKVPLSLSFDYTVLSDFKVAKTPISNPFIL